MDLVGGFIRTCQPSPRFTKGSIEHLSTTILNSQYICFNCDTPTSSSCKVYKSSVCLYFYLSPANQRLESTAFDSGRRRSNLLSERSNRSSLHHSIRHQECFVTSEYNAHHNVCPDSRNGRLEPNRHSSPSSTS